MRRPLYIYIYIYYIYIYIYIYIRSVWKVTGLGIMWHQWTKHAAHMLFCFCFCFFFQLARKLKRGAREMKEDSRSKRSSTSWIEVNVERVKHMMCGDRWLTIRMVANHLGKKRTAFGGLSPKILACGKSA